jgi:hypothetical protein
MKDGTITTKHLFLSEIFSNCPFWFIIIGKVGKKICSQGTVSLVRTVELEKETASHCLLWCPGLQIVV